MATLTEGKLDERASRDILYRYYVAMAVPFGIDFATSIVYAAINADLSVLVPMMAAALLKAKPRDVGKVRAFLAGCRNGDGGYGTKPGEKSTVGGVYYAAVVTRWLNDFEKK